MIKMNLLSVLSLSMMLFIGSATYAMEEEGRQVVPIPHDMSIPTDIFSQIFAHLPTKDIARYREVCSIFNRLLTDDTLIKEVLKKMGIENPQGDMLYDAYEHNDLGTIWLLLQDQSIDVNHYLINTQQFENALRNHYPEIFNKLLALQGLNNLTDILTKNEILLLHAIRLAHSMGPLLVLASKRFNDFDQKLLTILLQQRKLDANVFDYDNHSETPLYYLSNKKSLKAYKAYKKICAHEGYVAMNEQLRELTSSPQDNFPFRKKIIEKSYIYTGQAMLFTIIGSLSLYAIRHDRGWLPPQGFSPVDLILDNTIFVGASVYFLLNGYLELLSYTMGDSQIRNNDKKARFLTLLTGGFLLYTFFGSLLL